MAKYQVKQNEIEAIQYLGVTEPNFSERPEWLMQAIESGYLFVNNKGLFYKFRNAYLQVNKGDYIIKAGRALKLCGQEQFNETYEVAE